MRRKATTQRTACRGFVRASSGWRGPASPRPCDPRLRLATFPFRGCATSVRKRPIWRRSRAVRSGAQMPTQAAAQGSAKGLSSAASMRQEEVFDLGRVRVFASVVVAAAGAIGDRLGEIELTLMLAERRPECLDLARCRLRLLGGERMSVARGRGGAGPVVQELGRQCGRAVEHLPHCVPMRVQVVLGRAFARLRFAELVREPLRFDACAFELQRADMGDLARVVELVASLNRGSFNSDSSMAMASSRGLRVSASCRRKAMRAERSRNARSSCGLLHAAYSPDSTKVFEDS